MKQVNYKLIKLPDYNIIVSDEEIKVGELVLWSSNNPEGLECFNICISTNPIEEIGGGQKLIASDNPEHNIPSIDYNNLEEKYGIINIEKLADSFVKEYFYPDIQAKGENEESNNMKSFVLNWLKENFFNAKQFSLEDMKQSFDEGFDAHYESKYLTVQEEKDAYIQSLQQPKVFDIEIEMETDYSNVKEEHGSMWRAYVDYIPKITNNKIKILI